jgi:hypothetical protein
VGQKLNDPQTLNRYTYCENNPLRYTDPTGHWPNWGSIGSFCKGFDESIISCTLPYQLYTLTKATVQLCTELTSGQKTIQDLFTPSVTPTQALNNIVNGFTDYYNVTTPEGAGHLTGSIILTAATAALGAAASAGGNALQSIEEQPYTVSKGDLLNRVYDSRATVPSNGYSGLQGLSYCPGGVETPLSASQEIISRGLDSNVNNAQLGAVFEATQDIQATLRTSIGGTAREILIDRTSIDYLRVINTFFNKP